MFNPIERRADVFAAARTVHFVTIGAISVAAMTVGSVLVVTLWRPDQIALVIPTIIGITTPITMGLLAAGLKGFATVTNGQMGQIIHALQQKGEAEADAAHAQGMVAGLKEAPAILKEARREE